MIIPSKHSGYQAGIRLYPGGGDSGGAPTQQTVTQTNIPDYARPYVEDVLGRSQALATQNTYQSYGGQRVAGLTGLQNQAATSASNMTPSSQLNKAGDMASGVFNRAYTAGAYTPGQFNAVGPMMTSTGAFNQPGVAQSYMNPYMQAVVDIQKREATRNSDMLGEQQNAQAVGAGAFGGSRNAIVEAERQRNLTQQLGDIQATGSNAAFQQAQQAYMQDAARQLQSAQGNQSTLLGYGNQYLQAQQLGEQSRQFSNQAGLAGLNAQLNAAGLMQGVGQNLFDQRMGIAQLQNQIGSQQQATSQAQLDANYQDWVNRQMFPYRQLEFQNNILRGNYSPNTTTSVYGGYGSPVSQMAGLGTAAYGMSKMMAEGGAVDDVIDVNAREVDDEPGGLAKLLISQIQ